MVYNLLSNALKYRHPNRQLHVHVMYRTAGSGAVFLVQDNGLGLDLTHSDKLFALFERLHGHVEGSGVGLFMVKKMVENAGGRINVTSVLGTDSTFSVFSRYKCTSFPASCWSTTTRPPTT